jgi:probable F420-dependent oxidoreductase
MKSFRFGVVAAFARSGDEWVAKARQVESLGYATLVVPDNLRHTLAPLPALATAAAVTRRLRVGTYVLANDLRHPVLLAKDAASLDLLSGGRLELGIGAGRPNAADDYRMLGLPFESGSVRLARLAESLRVLKALFAGEPVPGSNADVSPRPLQQPRPPILVAGSGPRMLALAAREADIVALGVGPTADEAEVADKVRLVREAAGSVERFEQLELNINLMAVGHQVPRFIASQMGLSADDLARAGAISALVGAPDEMCATLQRRRDELGISYILVADELMEGLAPVVERLAGR